jgi:hypothetical protein
LPTIGGLLYGQRFPDLIKWLQTVKVNDILGHIFPQNVFQMKNPLIIADAHVHFHECFDIGQLLDRALKNFRKAAGGLFTALLFLTDTETDGWFVRHARGRADGEDKEKQTGDWTLQRTREDCSLIARSNSRDSLILIAGRQIQTAEGLEVLALGTVSRLEEGSSLETLIRQINQEGALPVIPWGVGKWFGARGNRVKTLLERGGKAPFFLGDNGNRPIFWPRPALFARADKKGMAILPGSDPLPFPSEIDKVGRFGFKVEGSLNLEFPCRDIKRLLGNRDNRLQSYGRLENPLRFFQNQLKMNLPGGCRG